MIRINLVAGERKAAKSAGRSFQIGQKMTVAGSLILVVTAVVIGWRFWALGQRDAQLTGDIDAARREETRLSEVLKQLATFEAQRTQLQQRVALIDELRKGQAAPVHMVDQISRALPDMAWLTSVKQDGYEITIEGNCLTLTALSDFVSSLEASRYFRRPVEIINSEVQPAKTNEPSLIKFTIKGTFQMMGIEQAPPATKGPARKAAPPAKGANNG
jgi:type IV pilus assembly protein PilN